MKETKKIKKANGLPSWFPLKIYGENLDARQWAGQIAMRLACKQTNKLKEDPETIFKVCILDKDDKSFDFFKNDQSLPLKKHGP